MLKLCDYATVSSAAGVSIQILVYIWPPPNTRIDHAFNGRIGLLILLKISRVKDPHKKYVQLVTFVTSS